MWTPRRIKCERCGFYCEAPVTIDPEARDAWVYIAFGDRAFNELMRLHRLANEIAEIRRQKLRVIRTKPT